MSVAVSEEVEEVERGGEEDSCVRDDADTSVRRLRLKPRSGAPVIPPADTVDGRVT